MPNQWSILVFLALSCHRYNLVHGDLGSLRELLHQKVGQLDCYDEYTSCFRWASSDYCIQLPDFMHSMCAKSCGLCKDTAVDPCLPVRDVVGPGAIASTFNRASKLGHLKPSVLSRDPFIVQFDEFISADEAEKLVELAEDVGFDAAGSSCAFKGWCNSTPMSCIPISGGQCWRHEAMKQFEERMLRVMGVKAENCEPIRFLRYRAGEAFERHQDAEGQDFRRNTPGGPRIWSLYVFLSHVEAGGSLNFPVLDVRIAPKPGRAVLWPHLLDTDLQTPDMRTVHEGSIVIEGKKVGVNFHAHRNNLRTRVMGGCGTGQVRHTFGYASSSHASPLHDMVGWLAAGAIPKLLSSRARIDESNDQGETPLDLAVAWGRVDVMRDLLHANASLERRDGKGYTALHHLSWKDRVDAVKELLSVKVSVNVASIDGTTPLHLAASFGQTSVASALLDARASVNAKTGSNDTAIHLAVKKGHAEILPLLLPSVDDVNVGDGTGATPFFRAIAEGKIWAARPLLEAKASVNTSPGASGLTPMHMAAVHGNFHAIKLLLDARASQNARDNFQKKTPLEYAKSKGHTEVQHILREEL